MTEVRTFGRLPGDFATYSLNDAAGAVRLCASSPVVAMDIETGSAKSVNKWKIKAFSVSDTETSYVLDPDLYADAIRECVARAATIVFHGAAYDVPIMAVNGLMRPADAAKVEDTLVMGRLAWPDSITHSNKLGPLADRVLGGAYSVLKSALEDGFKAINPRMSKAAMFDVLGLTSPAYVAYSAFDVLTTARVREALPAVLHDRMNPGLPGFRSTDAAYINEREQTVNRMLLRRSAIGINLDDEAADELVAELMAEAGIHRAVLVEHGVDPEQSMLAIKQELVATLADRGKLPPSWPRLKSGKPTTSKTWMERLEDNPVAQAANAMGQAQRFIKDYRDGAAGLSYLGRIHPQVSVQAAVTGRMSYGSPALQQYPSSVRRMFSFDVDITSFDWSSIEPVIAGNLSGAVTWIQGFEDGGDLYIPVAEAAGVTRKHAKTTLLAMIYGQGSESLSFRLGCDTEQAQEIQRTVKATMPEVTRMIRGLTAYGSQYGAVQTISGRVIPIPKDRETGNRRYLGYKATNYLIQGSAYDMLAESLYAMHAAGLDDALCLAIHDELVVHTEVAEDVARIMTTPPPALVEAARRVPALRVGRSDLGHNWNAKES